VGKLVGILVAVVAGLALATGVTFTVTSVAGPDSSVDLQTPPPANGADGVVNYGTP
jgi:hypothetical protein